MSSPLQPTDMHAVLTNHSALLEHAMIEQLGPIAALITRALSRNGALSLRDVITVIQQDPFLTAQVHQDNSSRLLPREGLGAGLGNASAAESGASFGATAPPALPTSAASSSPSRARAGARLAPLLNSTAAYVRAARSTPSNLFLDMPTKPNVGTSGASGASGASGHGGGAVSAGVVHALVHDPSLLTDAAVKEAMTRLVLHRLVRYDAESRSYELLLGYGILLRVLFPLVARLVRRLFGPAGEVIVRVLHRLALVPSWAAVMRLAQAEAPGMAAHELHQAGMRLLRAGWVQFLSAVAGEDATTSSTTAVMAQRSSDALAGAAAAFTSSRKRRRDDMEPSEEMTGGGGGGGSTPMLPDVSALQRPCRLCLQTLLSELYGDAVEQLMTTYYGSHLSMPGAIAAALLERAMPRYADWHPHHASGTHDSDDRQDARDGNEEMTTLFHHADDLSRAALRPGGFPPAPAPSRASTTDAPAERAVGHLLSLGDVSASVARHGRGTTLSDDAPTSTLSSEDEAALRRTLRRLSEHTPAAVRAPLVCTTASSSSSSNSSSAAPHHHHHHHHHHASLAIPRYALVLGPTSDALKAMACESVIFARHGVLGVRVWKLLTAYHALEDHTLAEECMSTQAKTREALHALMKDGYVAQREVPRNATQSSIWSAERVPRAFVFLWTTNMTQLVVPVVREQVAKSLLHALTKLALASASASRGPTESALTTLLSTASSPEMSARVTALDGTGAVGTASPQLADALRSQRALIGLQACALSLMQQLLVLDFF